MAKAKVIISADNNINQGLNSAKKSMTDFEKYIKGVESKLKKAFSISAIVAGAVTAVKGMKDALAGCVKEFEAADRVSQRLNAVWANVGTASGKTAGQVQALATSLERQTYFSAESIQEASLLLAATEKLTDEGFDRALQASMDLAAALGEDLTSSAQTLGKAIQEPEAALSRLKTVGISFTDEEKAQIKALTDANQLYEAQSIILDKVEQKYKDVAKAINKTPSGKLDNIKDVLSDIRKNLGGALLDSISPALDALYQTLLNISDWIDTALGNNKKMSVAAAAIYETNRPSQFYGGMELDFSDIIEERVTQALADLAEMSILDIEMAQAKAKERYDRLSAVLDAEDTRVIEAMETMIGLNEYIDYLKKNDLYAKRVAAAGGSGSSADDAGETVTEVVENAFQAFLKSYGNSSIEYQRKSYEAVIESAQSFLDEIDATIKANSLVGGPAVQANLDALRASLGIPDDEVLDLGNLKTMLNEIIATYNGKLEGLIPKVVEQTEENLVKKYGIEIPGLRTSEDEHTNEKFDNFMDGITASLEKNMGRAGEVASQLSDNMEKMGPVMGAMMTALEYVLQGFGEAVGPMLDVITDLLLAPLIEIGKMLGAIIVPVLQILAPILKLIETPLLVLSGTFQYVAQALQHWTATLLNWLADLNIFGWNPFAGLRTYDPGSPGNFGTYMNGYINSFGNYDAGGTASTETALSSASYRGATSVTINIYAEGPIVGDGGMRQFAQMIRDEFDALDYYGVGA